MFENKGYGAMRRHGNVEAVKLVLEVAGPRPQQRCSLGPELNDLPVYIHS